MTEKSLFCTSIAIRVADGTYSRVVVTNDIALDVRSVNGAATTIIDGGGTNNCVNVQLASNTYGQAIEA